MPRYKNVTLSKPLLSQSQVKFRLGLARQRTRTYPLDSMDFIMMDLERPDGHHRHAYQCTGDLTGRLLEFLAHAEGVDSQHDERLPVLFERILRQRRPSGLFGRTLTDPPTDEDISRASARLFPGFVHYYELTNDVRSLDAAVGLADLTVRSDGVWRKRLEASGGREIPFWITEPMALLYGVTENAAYLDFVQKINDKLEMPDKGAHAHGYMATLRGLQTAALVTGDAAWNAKPETARRMIIERHYELPDGCTPESFPHSGANEGCSIADWLMLNLNTGAILGDDAAYEHAEHILWNALAFNQWTTGCFGVRSTSPNGYSMRRFEEAWWCCVHHGGLGLVEYGLPSPCTLECVAVRFHDGGPLDPQAGSCLPRPATLPVADRLAASRPQYPLAVLQGPPVYHAQPSDVLVMPERTTPASRGRISRTGSHMKPPPTATSAPAANIFHSGKFAGTMDGSRGRTECTALQGTYAGLARPMGSAQKTFTLAVRCGSVRATPCSEGIEAGWRRTKLNACMQDAKD